MEIAEEGKEREKEKVLLPKWLPLVAEVETERALLLQY